MITLNKIGDYHNRQVLEIECLKADEKPIGTIDGLVITNGSKLHELDGSTYEYDEQNKTWVLQPKSSGGTDGREIELQKTQTHIQWRYVGTEEWFDLVSLDEISFKHSDFTPEQLQALKGVKGDKGDPGTNGTNGKDGLSIKSTQINDSGHLILTFSDESTKDVGKVTGENGESAYQIAVRLGFHGTEQEWIESLKYNHSEEFTKLAEEVRSTASNIAAERQQITQNTNDVTKLKEDIAGLEKNKLHLIFDNTESKTIDNGKWVTWDNIPTFTYSDAIKVKSGTKIHVDYDFSKRCYLPVCGFFKTENIENEIPLTNSYKYDELSGSFDIVVPEGYSYVAFNNTASGMGTQLKIPTFSLGCNYLVEELVNTEMNVEKLDEYIGINSPDKVCLKLPDCYDLVVGDTFELFYKGIINSAHPELYDVIADCAKGSAYTKRFLITPTLAENLTLTVTLYGINHTIVDRKSVILRVNEKAKSPISKTNILCIGDSLTTGGTWVSELHRRITGTGGNPNADNLSNINFIGSRQINETRYEGYGGWTFNSYNTENVNSNTRIITCTHSKNSNDQHSVYRDTTGATWKLETIEETTIRIIAVSGEGRNFPDSGTLKWVSGGINHDDIVYTSQVEAPGNPFWDTAKNKVDFEGYASKNGVADIHYMYVLLGWNSASDSEEKYKNNVRIFINNVLSAFPNCKIVLMGLQLPARDGLGANYGATGIYSRYFDLMRHVWNLDKWYKDISLEFPNKVTTINIAGQFDTENNMPESTRTVNARNSKEETYQTNGVHPDTTGYYQIADAAYRDLINKLQAS